MLNAVIVGAGHRALGYAKYAELHPDRLRVVGVADLFPERRQAVARLYSLPPEHCFESLDAMLAHGRIADVAINGTMDHQHVATTIPLLETGYDVLLEKPFAVNAGELRKLAEGVHKTGHKVMICHVLRYAPFYREIKARIAAGTVGEIIDIQTAEHVSYHHFSACYVRGKWGRQDACNGATSLLAKCSHDLDLIAWLKSGIRPVSVDSMGSLRYFTRKNAPEHSGTHCLLDCPLVDTCDFSVKRLHLDHPVRWAAYIWPELAYLPERNTPEQRRAALCDPAHPYSRCVWKCDNDQPDRQSVMIEFEDGSLATHSMIADTARPMRRIHVIGTEGEIEGVFDDNRFVVRHRDLRPGHEYGEEVVDTGDLGDTTGAYGDHGGGDLRLVEDFVNYSEGKPASLSCTALTDSLTGHLLVFAADEARLRKRRIDFTEFCKGITAIR